MLIDKGYSADDVISFKLSNGDEIVGKLIKETDTDYVLSHAMTVVPSQNGVGLMQSMFTVAPNSQFRLSKNHVMMHNLTVDQMSDHYREITTGIQTVRKGNIIV